MNSFGDYQQTKEFVSRHMTICLHLSKMYENRALEAVVDLEHRIVTTDPTDSKFKKLLKEVEKTLQNPNIEYFIFNIDIWIKFD